MKIRVSMHAGKQGSTKHNDRSFLKELDDGSIQEKANHIDLDKIGFNKILLNEDMGSADESEAILRGNLSLRQKELEMYQNLFGEALEAQNERYKASGHVKKVRTMEDWYKDRNRRPTEVILQIGDKSTDISRDKFNLAVTELNKRLRDWSKGHGDVLQVLSTSIHHDETSPHAHMRYIWAYQDDGVRKIGQNRALEQAGVPLPKPKNKETAKNNRKVTFDKMVRGWWQDIAKNLGYEVETTPIPGRRHKGKEEFIDDQIAKKHLKSQNLSARIKNLESHVIDLEKQLEQELASKMVLEKQIEEAQALKERVQELSFLEKLGLKRIERLETLLSEKDKRITELQEENHKILKTPKGDREARLERENTRLKERLSDSEFRVKKLLAQSPENLVTNAIDRGSKQYQSHLDKALEFALNQPEEPPKKKGQTAPSGKE